MLVATGYMWLE